MAEIPLEDVVCPKCGACNRPRAMVIERDQDGTLVCKVCAHDWKP